MMEDVYEFLRWIGIVIAMVISGTTLGAQLASRERIETRRLIVQEREGGPRIEAGVAEDGGLALEFVDAWGNRRLRLAYVSPSAEAKQEGESAQASLVVEDGWAGLTLEAGSARAVVSTDRALTGAQVALSNADRAAVFGSSPLINGVKGWSGTGEEFTSVEMRAESTRAQIGLQRGQSHLDLEAAREGRAQVRLWNGKTRVTESVMATDARGSSFTMRDLDGRAPIQLSSGKEGSVRLIPGPAGEVHECHRDAPH